MRQALRRSVICGGLGLLGLVVAGLVLLAGSLSAARLQEHWRAERMSELGGLRARLEGELNGAVNLTAGLIADVAAYGGIGEDEFELLARELMAQRSLLRNITLAPDNVIAMVYPRAGNEAALGLDLLNHPVQGEATRAMLDSRRPMLAGPLELAQGGRALVHRVPIFLTPRGGAPRSGPYWGLMSTPIDFDRLLAAAGLSDPALPFALALRGANAQGRQGAPFWGDPALFERADTLRVTIDVLDGHWELAALPFGDVPGAAVVRWSARAVALACALVTALLVWLLYRVDRRLAESETLHRELAEQIDDVLFRTDAAGRVVYLNPAWTRLTGREAQHCLGSHWRALVEPVAADGAAAPDAPGSGDVLALQDGRVRLRDHAGQPRTLSVRVGAHRNAEGEIEGAVGIMVDVSAQEALEARVRHLALHDSLTGLANRVLLASRFEQAASLARRGQYGLALLYLDLDGFKPVNDRHGHAVGDELLCALAARLREVVRDSDTVARVGGDEFVILLGRIAGAEAACALAAKVEDALAQAQVVAGVPLAVGVSIGIALFPEHGDSLDALMRSADRAMYRVKADRRGAPTGTVSAP